VAACAHDERLVVCGTAIDPLAGKLLRDLRRGSTVKKIPSSILEEYRQARWSPLSVEVEQAYKDRRLAEADEPAEGNGAREAVAAEAVTEPGAAS
jgi:hypothetical protein